MTRLPLLAAALLVAALPAPAQPPAQPPAQVPAQVPAQPPPRTVLAVGAHAGDMELTAGAVLAKARREGARVVLLHLTLGEGGNPRLSPEAYGAQKRREAT